MFNDALDMPGTSGSGTGNSSKLKCLYYHGGTQFTAPAIAERPIDENDAVAVHLARYSSYTSKRGSSHPALLVKPATSRQDWPGTATARNLGIHRQSLQRKIALLGVNRC